VPGDGSAFRFSHDLVRHSLHAGLNAVQRTRIHEAVALALEELHATRLEPVVAELAHHFSEALPAGDAGKAMRYLALAGDRAAKLAAPQEAASLYSRAADIGKANGADSDWLRGLYMKLAEQLIDLGDLKRMKGALEEAEARPPAEPDPSWDARVGVARAHLAMLDASALDEDRIFESIALFDQLDDPLNASRAWSALVVLNCGRSNRLKGNEAAEQALVCAQRGGSRVLIGQAMRSIGSVMALGAAPVPEAIARVRALLDQTGDDAFTRARLMNCLASLENSHGRFDEARALIAQARATAPPTERANVESFLLSTSSRLELDAGNPVRAEEMARASCAALETQGFVRYLSSELMFLVDALIAQGKLDEALIHLERAAPMAAPDDADALLRQARSRALLELARGNVELAIESARVSLAHAENAYAPDELAECHLVLGRALLAAGRASDAHTEAAEARRVSEERENVVLAQRARAMLAPAARPVAMSR
jgi:tetratricopeptide (TPR) repeat protein